jgi:hypothetical protein
MNAFDSKITLEKSEIPVTTDKVITLLSESLSKDVSDEVKEVLKKKSAEKTDNDALLTKRELAVLIDAVVHPFDREIGFDGQYK